jgi:hypothetical protein
MVASFVVNPVYNTELPHPSLLEGGFNQEKNRK